MKNAAAAYVKHRGLRRLGAALVAAALAACTAAPHEPEGQAGVAQTVQAGELRVTLRVDAAALGQRVFDVDVRDAGGRAVDARDVRLRFTMAEMDMGVVEAQAQPVAPGQYRAQGAPFSMVGLWAVEVMLQRDGQAPLLVPFALAVAAPGEASGPLNPLAPNPATLAAGAALYAANCAVCHGASGMGDGPGGVGLSPRPGDLTQHMLPGKHTDGQVFLWVRDGVPGTAMPAWGARLSDEQIWQLVTHLRTLTQPVAPPEDTAASTAIPTPPPPTAPAGEPLPPLVFVRGGQLWRSDGTAAEPRAITQLAPGGYAQHPAIAPGGEVAFIITSQGPIPEDAPLPLPVPRTQLAALDGDGGAPRVLWAPERGVLGRPAWSPDGRSVAIGWFDVRSAPGAPVPDQVFQVVRVDAQTGEREIMFEDAYDLAFAADGRQVVFLRWHANVAAFSLRVADMGGANERELVGWSRFSGLNAPVFAPDGRSVLFVATGGPPTDERGYPISAGSAPLGGLLGLLAPPVAEAHAAPQDIWVVGIDGSGLRRLTAIREDTPSAAFSPDGAQVAVMGGRGIYLLDADGSDLRKLDRAGDHGGLAWWAP